MSETTTYHFKKKVSETRPNVIHARVTEETFKRVLAVAHKWGNGNMSDLINDCILYALDHVEKEYKARIKERYEQLEKD